MTDIPATAPRKWKLDGALVASALIPVILWFIAPEDIWPTLTFAFGALAHTAPFILFAILAVAYLKATNAETLLARAFEGRETRMIVLAALFGGISPFCSCEVIPFIAAMLAVGAPLSAVMAFWLASPLMDPAMFAITAGTLGVEFALAKGFAAVMIGLMGGFSVKALAGSFLFADPLKNAPVKSCCSSGCGAGDEVSPLSGAINWRFWQEADRRAIFRTTAAENAFFLGKWLLLAYLIEALMLKYIPADWVAQVLGGEGIGPILLGAFVGAPAYLNGYAAVPMVEALLAQGMSQGAAMSFVIAGGVSCIPAAVAVWALVKPRVFVAYLALAVVGAVLAGLGWNMVAPI
ncbi:permease [Aliiroseovarius crassostreae]|uniref:permease n=1 Tax=Aliiroseovarius crassostreae TaxID=154981 RepID=UPI0021F9791C|nr:permease [Aliiroseovarius crassostreae]UWP99220.1 permease [Aliiroseovarius crassostreae]UWQ02416.1 permease [Aliiroseovarius crassostreae]